MGNMDGHVQHMFEYLEHVEGDATPPATIEANVLAG